MNEMTIVAQYDYIAELLLDEQLSDGIWR